MRPGTTLHPEQPDHAECERRFTQAYDQVRSLETMLLTARQISIAVGIVMANYKISDDAAVDLLLAASKHSQCDLREIAQLVIATRELKWSPMWFGAPS
jgi:AmiR/NasT family two-component response regulator